MIARNFYADNVLYPTVEWWKTYDEQTAQMTDIMGRAAPGTGQFVMVGFSNGGILSRRAGELRPDLVRGVVGVSTPHAGVPAMRTARAVFDVIFKVPVLGMAASCAIRNHAGCQAGTAVKTILSFFPIGADDLVPVSRQMVPRSPYLQSLNGAYEGFRRVSIEQHARQRWVWWRLIKDLNCAGPEQWCGGRQAVRKLDNAYKDLIAQAVVSGILGFVVPGLHAYTVVAATAVAALNAVDHLWDRITSPADGSDGLVPNASQAYPAAELHVVINNADSHDAAKKSVDKTLDRLGQVLARQLGVPPTPQGIYR
jgi:pimeloyl-ACP methyl ester carboxylesterase